MTSKKVSIFFIKEEKYSISLGMEALTVNNEQRAIANDDGAMSCGVYLSYSMSSDDWSGGSKTTYKSFKEVGKVQ